MKKYLLTIASVLSLCSLWAQSPAVADSSLVPDTLVPDTLVSDTLTLTETFNQPAPLPHRPKVALVLAGGGAKGLAHIGVLKVLEEAGLPIDMVVGNSMGSIVGGLYAIGYNSHQLDSVVRETNWMNLLLDTPDYQSQLLTNKKMSETYQLRVSLDPERRRRQGGKSGLIEGRNIYRHLLSLTEGYTDSLSFDSLPLPFACNATEVHGGKVVEFHSGKLAEAMRASMAIPGVFTPVHKDSMLLVDGFVTNNYPVDVARRMGADIIVGIDLVSNVPEEERYTGLLDLVTHMLDLSSTGQYKKNVDDTNLYIDVDVSEYSAASFGREDIDSLIRRGERKARQLLPQIKHLRDTILAMGHDDFEKKHYSKPESNQLKNTISRFTQTYKNSSINLGARFDNDEFASVHAGIILNIPSSRHLMVQLYARLGQRMKGGISLRQYVRDNTRFTMSYYLEDRELKYYNCGKRIASIASMHQRTRLYFSQEWKRVQYNFGMRYDWHKYDDILVLSDIINQPKRSVRERFFTYFAQAEYNSMNSNYFPKQGSYIDASMELVTDNLYKYDGAKPIPIAQLQLCTAIRMFSSRFTLLPHASARILFSNHETTPLALLNVVGGLQPGLKIAHQLTMAGISELEILPEKGFCCIGLGMQQNIGTDHYIQLGLDGAMISDTWENALDKESHTYGFKLGYSYDTGAGPISLATCWSERTHKFDVLFNIGYCF